MKILMFINPYLNLVDPVIDELKSQGHEVTVINDFFEYYDPKDVFRRNRLNEKKIRFWNESVSTYWMKHEDIIADKFDVFISFNGWSINSTAFDLIDKYSPECIKVQYCWDSFYSKDLRMAEKYFDKLYTFDINDAKNPGWKLLPSFYAVKDIRKGNETEEYDLFMIGANHDKRYSFVRKVLRDLKSQDLNNYIKIYVYQMHNLVLNFSIDCVKSLLNPRHIHEMLFKYGLENKEIAINQQIDAEEYMRFMQKSRCILDDNCDGQAGLSPRFIRAMVLNKKVITTNKWARDYSFVNEKNVLIVDKDRPVIDVDFIKSETCPPKASNLDYLELSTWVRILIGEIECPSFEKTE